MAGVSPAPRQPSTSCASPAPSAAPLRARRSAGRSRGAPPPPPRVTAPPPPPRARCAPTREARRGREWGGCGVGLVQRGAPAPSPADRLVQAPPRAAPAPSRAAAGRRTAPPPRRQPRRWATPWVWVVGANSGLYIPLPYQNRLQHCKQTPTAWRVPLVRSSPKRPSLALPRSSAARGCRWAALPPGLRRQDGVPGQPRLAPPTLQKIGQRSCGSVQCTSA